MRGVIPSGCRKGRKLQAQRARSLFIPHGRTGEKRVIKERRQCALASFFSPYPRVMPRIPHLKSLEDLVTEYHGNFLVRTWS